MTKNRIELKVVKFLLSETMTGKFTSKETFNREIAEAHTDELLKDILGPHVPQDKVELARNEIKVLWTEIHKDDDFTEWHDGHLEFTAASNDPDHAVESIMMEEVVMLFSLAEAIADQLKPLNQF